MLQLLPVATQGKVSVVHRVIAKAIDLLGVFFLAWVLFYPIGPLLGFLYSLFADGMNFGPFEGQSLGKKLMKLQVVHMGTTSGHRTGPITRANWKDSALRNTPVGVATFFAIIPIWGWLILALIGIPLMIMEIYLMVRVERGHRLGDVMGDTEVVDVGRVFKT